MPAVQSELSHRMRRADEAHAALAAAESELSRARSDAHASAHEARARMEAAEAQAGAATRAREQASASLSSSQVGSSSPQVGSDAPVVRVDSHVCVHMTYAQSLGSFLKKASLCCQVRVVRMLYAVALGTEAGTCSTFATLNVLVTLLNSVAFYLKWCTCMGFATVHYDLL